MIAVLVLLALSAARGARLPSIRAGQADVQYAGAVAVLYDPQGPIPPKSRAHSIGYCPSPHIPAAVCPQDAGHVVLAAGLDATAIRRLDAASVANATQFAVIPTPCAANPSDPCPYYVLVTAFAAGWDHCVGSAAACRLLGPARRNRGALLGTAASVLDLIKHADVHAEWGRERPVADGADGSLLQVSAPAHAKRARRRRRQAKTSIGTTLRDGEHVDMASVPTGSFDLLRFSGTMTPDNAFTSCSIEGQVQRCQPDSSVVGGESGCRNQTSLQTNVPSPAPLLASCSKMSLADLQKQASAANQLQRLSATGMWSLLRGQHFDGAAFNQTVRELKDEINAGATMAQACPAAGLVHCTTCKLAFSGRIAVHMQVLFSAFERVVLTMSGKTTVSGSLEVQSIAGMYMGDDNKPFQVESEPVELQLLLGDVPVLLVVRGGADLDTTIRLAGSGTLSTRLIVERGMHLKAGYVKGRGAFLAPPELGRAQVTQKHSDVVGVVSMALENVFTHRMEATVMASPPLPPRLGASERSAAKAVTSATRKAFRLVLSLEAEFAQLMELEFIDRNFTVCGKGETTAGLSMEATATAPEDIAAPSTTVTFGENHPEPAARLMDDVSEVGGCWGPVYHVPFGDEPVDITAPAYTDDGTQAVENMARVAQAQAQNGGAEEEEEDGDDEPPPDLP